MDSVVFFCLRRRVVVRDRGVIIDVHHVVHVATASRTSWRYERAAGWAGPGAVGNLVPYPPGQCRLTSEFGSRTQRDVGQGSASVRIYKE